MTYLIHWIYLDIFFGANDPVMLLYVSMYLYYTLLSYHMLVINV